MAEPLARVRGWLERCGAPGLVATRPGTVAWLTSGLNLPIDRTAGTDLVWVVVTPTDAFLVTTEVELDRIHAEFRPELDLVAVPWYDEDGFVVAASAGLNRTMLASDGHPAFGVDATDDLTALRLALGEEERQALRELGADATAAVERALRDWRPGDRDRDVAAAIAAGVESTGADAPVLIVGGDDRLRAYRHPLAIGEPMREVAMAVLVARRGGLHVALTRYAGKVPDLAGVRRIEAAVLGACRTGETYGDALSALDAAYAAEGQPGGWRGHYQGGPIGYAQREFEISPGNRASRWYRQPVEAGHALAWNPSLPGGAKTEDTYLLTEDGLELVTTCDLEGTA